MKKLLVILLLFFPVHGAWAGNKLHLTCHIPDLSITDFFIDLTKKTMTAYIGGENLSNVSITPNTFSSEALPSTLKTTNEMTKSISRKRITKQVYRIYRHDGSYEMLTQYNNGTTDIDKGNCIEASKKKF